MSEPTGPNAAAIRWRERQRMLSSLDEAHEVTGVNKFCNESDLGNEASVEQFFVGRLLTDLGYSDSQIRPKTSLSELPLHQGRTAVKWKPDYAIEVNGRIRWIVEAKPVSESLDKWVGQAGSYCLELNRTFSEENPVEYFMLTNGVTTRVYRWDNHKPLIEAKFGDFVDGNAHFEHLREILGADNIERAPAAPVERHPLRRHSVDQLNADFTWAHRLIFRSEALSYTAAFMEFVKIVFLKLKSDHDAHNNPLFREEDHETGSVPAGDVRFSVRWIESMESHASSPLDQLHFAELMKEFERDIAASKMKRIFEPGEGLKLSGDTIKALVRRFEHIDLRSIDADLNGRMFETYLDAALRGKDLGQFFTPRSVVKLATGLADLKVTGEQPTRVLDACCGTGGFLIEALSDMNEKARKLPRSPEQRKELEKKIQRSILGVDVARDPALARIARINMYLHGDKDSKIFQLDALDKKVSSANNDDIEASREKDEFRALIAAGDEKGQDGHPLGVVDVVLTNPPFAKEYNRREKNEDRILSDYSLAVRDTGGKKEPLQKLSSMVLFLERYYDLLAPGGHLVTVLDDGILGAKNNKFVRDWIRRNWLIKAVVSLPGDAFQRSQARVKTSILVLEKKREAGEKQPDVFMYYCGYVGIDDPPRQRRLPIDVVNRKKAIEEIATVNRLYAAFQRGEADAAPWTVRAADLGDRLDVKANLIRPGEQVEAWKAAELEVVTVSSLLAPVESSRIFSSAEEEGLGRYLRVRYDGFCEAGEEFDYGDVATQRFTRVRTGDLVFSHINTVHGAIGVVPKELDGCVVTNEYSVCRALEKKDTPVIWTLLRSIQARADLIALATGIGRTRVGWSEISKLQVPWPDAMLRKKVREAFKAANAAERRAHTLRIETAAAVSAQLALAPVRAKEVISAFKPPR